MTEHEPAGWVEPPLTDLEARLIDILEPVVLDAGLFLLELSMVSDGRGRVLRLFVDNREQGVNLDQCGVLSRQLGDLLDVEDIISERYHLEISSPGLTRKLKYAREFQLLGGRRIRILVRGECKNQYLTGLLHGRDGDDVLLEIHGEIKRIALYDIIRAQLHPEL
ncbi:MAG: ribosome maturation factor RimP [Desulfarculales bacterium]|nr:ribosome maturation factor RimP [Desulfarculales bacterium]